MLSPRPRRPGPGAGAAAAGATLQLALGLGLWQAKESCNGSFSARSQCWSALVNVLVFDNRVVVSKCTQLQVVRYCERQTILVQSTRAHPHTQSITFKIGISSAAKGADMRLTTPGGTHSENENEHPRPSRVYHTHTQHSHTHTCNMKGDGARQ